MEQLGRDFRSYVLSQEVPGGTVRQDDDDHITLTSKHATGQVNFYSFEGMPEIVELSIVDPDRPDEPKFFLHFELEDQRRAEELFGEMLEALQEEERYDTTRVLLCCTAGLTTTMFANKLQEAAKTLSLDYSFEAMPLEQAKEVGGGFDAVLLAPQVGYQRAAVAKAFPDAAVVPIPPKVFASYDAGACLKLVMHLLSDNTVFPSADAGSLRFARNLKNDERVMVITCVSRPKRSFVGWRIYDGDSVAAHGSITKDRPDWRDIEDILATLPMKGWQVRDLDAVGIAVPGVVNKGSVSFSGHVGFGDYELGRILSERYGVKVFVDNNANAAAVGCYVSQDDYDSVVLHTQQTGTLVGGQGIVVDGHLAKGRANYAGQLMALSNALFRDRPLEPDQAWTPEGMRQIVARTLVADICVVAPDAIFVAVDLVYDMDTLRDDIAGFFGDNEGFIPDLVRVSDYRELISIGELALCLQKMHNPRPHRKH